MEWLLLKGEVHDKEQRKKPMKERFVAKLQELFQVS